MSLGIYDLLEMVETINPHKTDGSYEYYTDSMFASGKKIKGIKNAMMLIRAYYTKHSNRVAGCFCARGIRVILEWSLKEINKK